MSIEQLELATVPAELRLADVLSRQTRAYLDARGLPPSWQVFCHDLYDFADIDRFLDDLVAPDDPPLSWDPPPSGEALGAPLPTQLLTAKHDAETPPRGFGFLYVLQYDVVIGRWPLRLPQGWSTLETIAAPSVEACVELASRLRGLRAQRGRACWQVVGGAPWDPELQLPRDLRVGLDDLILEPPLRDRIKHEVMEFFSPRVETLHRELGVPWRQGVLLYGAPGCGKTSICRAVAARHPEVPAMVLRPAANFNNDSLRAAFAQLASVAPAILVIEDIDVLLTQHISVSNLLNLMDGIGSPSAGALILATTNRAEALPPALSDRPGRFVTLEVPAPTPDLREAYLGRKLGHLGANVLEELTQGSQGLGFAHLQEIVKVSALHALQAGRRLIEPDDTRQALSAVVRGHHAARDAFVAATETSFGFGPTQG